MTWAVKYKTEIKDLYGVDFKVDIEEDAAGFVANLKSTGDPISFDFDNESDDIVEPIKASSVSFSVYSTSNFALTDLYAIQDMQFRVKIYQNTVLYWMGYIVTRHYEEPYEDYPYSVKVTACCGMELLKEILYDNAGTYYNGRTLESQIILDILGKIEHTTFTEYVNIYEESMDDGTGDSPMDQLKIDVDVFQDMYCDEVLKELLKKYNACIIQKAGVFCIYRPVELIGATVYGRTFTAATTKSSTSFSPLQYINRSGHSTTREQVSGGVLMIQSPAKNIKIVQDYGYKDSWIDNWKFEGDRFSGSIGTAFYAEGWTRTTDPSLLIFPIRIAMPSEFDGVILSTHNNYPTLDTYLYQSFGTYLISTTDVIAFELEYMFYNSSGTARTGQVFYIQVKADGANQYLKNDTDEYLQWDTSSAYITITDDAPIGSSGWISFKRKVPGIPASGSYTIKLFGLDDTYPTIYIGIKNIKILSTADAMILGKTKSYIWPFGWLKKWKRFYKYIDRPEVVENEYLPTCTPDHGRDMIYNYLLGDVVGSEIDNVLEQFAGSLATYITTLLLRKDTVTLTGSSGSCDITCNELEKTCVYDPGGLAATALAFKDAFAEDYLAVDITLTNSGVTLIFESTVPGMDFDTTVVENIADLDGTVANTQPETASYAISASSDWNTRSPGGESKPLLEIIGDEIAKQYSRPKQLIQMPIIDTGTAVSAINILGNFQDDLNQISAVNRKFIFNRGNFDVKNRKWEIDLMEIIE